MTPRLPRVRRIALALAFALAAAILGTRCDSPATKPVVTPPSPPASEAELVTALQDAYATHDAPWFESLLHPEFGLVSEYGSWCHEAHVCIHRRMFASAGGTAVDPPLYPDLEVLSITPDFQPLSAFTPIHNYDRTTVFPAGLDPDRWKLTAAPCRVTALFNLRGDTDYRPASTSLLVVAEDLAKARGEAGKYTLFRWSETQYSAVEGAPGKSENRHWGAFLSLFGDGCEFCENGPPRPPVPDFIETPEEVAQAVAASIAGLTPATYESLLFDDFRYYVDASVPGDRWWSRDEELRIFGRMARPQDYGSTGSPVPPGLWPTGLEFLLTRTSNFTERSEYYASASNSTGLDRMRWRVVAAVFRINGNLHTAGGSLEFAGNTTAIVAEDLQTPRGAGNRFFLYRWFDSGLPVMQSASTASAVPALSWSAVKEQYR